jgi:predicted outer membrane repeat protein
MPCRRRSAVLFLFVALFCALPALGAPRKAAAKVIRVPKDVKDLSTAIRSAKDGDIIELAAGTYTPPSKGFSISNLGKAFTVRAAAGATVILDGKKTATILRFKNGSRARGKRVTFERLTFQNGFSKTIGDGGAVTISAAEARFVDCKFLSSSATSTSGGGAVRVLAGSDATFVNTEWRGNSASTRGGALEVLLSTAAIEGGSFIENRTNLPGHSKVASGGAVYVLDSTLRVTGTRFERNQAGWVGGAIYAYGNWSDPVSVPKSDLTVVRSTFVENVAINDPGTPLTFATQGGAIHVENQTTLRLQHSHLLGNKARLGGGIDNYRAVVEVTGSQFQWNRALEGAVFGSGGAIFAASNETSADGVLNRRTSTVTIADSMLQGGTGQPSAHTGGCVTIGGDISRAYGENGAVQMGTLDENRARLEVRRSVFADCDVQQEPTGGGGFGGALQSVLSNLILEDSMVLESDARGGNAGGGGVSVQGESVAVIARTTFARNTAGNAGGALHAGGSTIQVSQCRFFGNLAGALGALTQSRGAAVFTIPLLAQQRPRNVGGVISDSLFSQNTGLAVWDVEPASGPVNEMRYTNNQFHETTFGDKVYFHSKLAQGGVNATGMNQIKSHSGNLRQSSTPVAGTLLAAPSVVGTGAPAAAGTFLHFAWSGRSATLDGQALTVKSGIAPAGPGAHSLVVDGTQIGSLTLGAATCPKKGTVCLAGGRFEIRVPGARLLTQEADTAFLSLPGGETLAVQILDRRDKNGHFWLARSVSKVSALSALSGHTLEITDTATGETRTWAWSPGESDTEIDSVAFRD